MRLLRKIKAFIFRTFVSDCAHCHKHFYGFHAHRQHVSLNGKRYRIVCHRCAIKVIL